MLLLASGVRLFSQCGGEHLTHSDRVINIDYRFSLEASILPPSTQNLQKICRFFLL